MRNRGVPEMYENRRSVQQIRRKETYSFAEEKWTKKKRTNKSTRKEICTPTSVQVPNNEPTQTLTLIDK